MEPMKGYHAGESMSASLFTPRVVIEDLENKETESPPADSTVAPLPSLQSQMLAHRVSKAFAKQSNVTTVTREEFQAFHAFWQDWLRKPLPKNWAQAEDFLQAKTAYGGILEDLYGNYQRLSVIYSNKKAHKISNQDIKLRQQFAFQLGVLTMLFGQMCERDLGLQEKLKALTELCGGDPGFAFGANAFAYKQHYHDHIHSHFLIYQRFANFLQQMLEKERAEALKYPFRAIEIKKDAYLAFLKDGNGYIPVPYRVNPQTFEVTNVLYGESALPSEKLGAQHIVFLIDHGKVVTQSGFLLELNRSMQRVVASIQGFYGEETDTPFCVTELSQIASLNAPVAKLQYLLALLADEVEAFKLSSKMQDYYFIRLPQQGRESKEFGYCFLQEMIIRSKVTVRPEEQKQAAEWLKQIEHIEGKPAEEVVQELEAEIKADMRSQYEREVEEEQRLRSQKVIEGATQGAGLAKKHRKGKKQQKAQQVAKMESPPKTIDRRVEEAFQELKVNGRIKFRKMIKMAQTILKLHPDTLTKALKDEKQQGSHHVLHMEQGTATIVHPHGRQDKTISPKSANRFLGAIIDQINKTLTS